MSGRTQQAPCTGPEQEAARDHSQYEIVVDPPSPCPATPEHTPSAHWDPTGDEKSAPDSPNRGGKRSRAALIAAIETLSDRFTTGFDELRQRLDAIERQGKEPRSHRTPSHVPPEPTWLTAPAAGGYAHNVPAWPCAKRGSDSNSNDNSKRRSVKHFPSFSEACASVASGAGALANPLAAGMATDRSEDSQTSQSHTVVNHPRLKRRGTTVVWTAQQEDVAATMGFLDLMSRSNNPTGSGYLVDGPVTAPREGAPGGEGGAPAKAPQQPRGASGWAQSHPAMVAADFLFIVTSVAAACAPLKCAIVGYDSMGPTSFGVSLTAALISQAYYWVFIGTRLVMQRLDGWEIVHFREDIRRHYLRGAFRFDVLLAAPVDWVFLGWATPLFFYGQLRHLLRLGRNFTLVQSLNPLERSRKWVILLCDLAVVAVFMHAAACVFMAIEGTDYTTAFYWAATTASSVGYGDVVPSDSLGPRCFAIFIMLLGLATVATLTGTVTWLLSSKDALQEQADEKKQMLASMMRFYDIPWDVQVEVIAMLPAVLDAEHGHHFKRLTQDLPGFLVDKIESYTRAKALADAIPLFSECDISVRREVARRLVHRFHQANEPIIVAGDEGFEMFFLVRGAADVLVALPGGDSLIVATLRAGSFFGEIALLESVTRTASVVSVSPTEVLALSKQNYEELAELYADVRRVFDTVIKEAQARKQTNARCEL